VIIYRFVLLLYDLAVRITSTCSNKSKLWLEGRKKWKSKLSAIQFQNDKWIWFHASSFGEFNDGRTLLEAVKRKYPQYKVLLTFFSPSGYEANKNYEFADAILYLPLDTKANARHFIDQVNPFMAFFMRNDIWPNYLLEISKRNIPAFLYSFTISNKNNFVKFPQKIFYRRFFNLFTRIFVHIKRSKEILLENQFNNSISVSGNPRADAILENSAENFTDERVQAFIQNNFCILAGSTHSKDRELFSKTYTNLSRWNIKWIIVPHEISQLEIANAKNFFGEKMTLYSEQQENKSSDILWIDKVGMLSKLYRYASVVFIGGGFDKMGIHNILEPAVYGCPVCFGPNHRNYVEAIEILNYGGAEIVFNEKDLANFIALYRDNKDLLKKIQELNKGYVQENAGATIRVLQTLEEKGYFS
jgi:3-deoxy-D-manno-octulosonic-acid transferase